MSSKGSFKNHYFPNASAIRVVTGKGDGNCLPRALCVAFGRSEENYMEIKKIIEHEYFENRKHYFLDQENQEYNNKLIVCLEDKSWMAVPMDVLCDARFYNHQKKNLY